MSEKKLNNNQITQASKRKNTSNSIISSSHIQFIRNFYNNNKQSFRLI